MPPVRASPAEVTAPISKRRETVILVRKHERTLLFKNGDFVRFLLPGTHYELDRLKRVTVDLYDITVPLFEHRLADFLVKEHAEDGAHREGARGGRGQEPPACRRERGLQPRA